MWLLSITNKFQPFHKLGFLQTQKQCRLKSCDLVCFNSRVIRRRVRTMQSLVQTTTPQRSALHGSIQLTRMYSCDPPNSLLLFSSPPTMDYSNIHYRNPYFSIIQLSILRLLFIILHIHSISALLNLITVIIMK